MGWRWDPALLGHWARRRREVCTSRDARSSGGITGTFGEQGTHLGRRAGEIATVLITVVAHLAVLGGRPRFEVLGPDRMSSPQGNARRDARVKLALELGDGAEYVLYLFESG